MRTQAPFFSRLAKGTSRLVGKPVTFAVVVTLVIAWALSGPMFGFSDSWQLVINTGTTIVTFLMVFLIQATQNRDAEAIQIKLDELLRAQRGAHNAMMNLEEMEEDELREVHATYQRLAEEARKRLAQGIEDTGVPDFERKKR